VRRLDGPPPSPAHFDLVKKRKRALLIAGIVVAALIGIMAAGAFPGMGFVRRMTVSPVDLSKIADGVYPGSFRAGRFSYSVEVTVKDHKIEAVKSAGRKQAQDAVTRQIFARIVEGQSVQADTVSGASLTTKAVSKAVENALSPAH
jgi:uncharacterized protein with FMN-binding domain